MVVTTFPGVWARRTSRGRGSWAGRGPWQCVAGPLHSLSPAIPASTTVGFPPHQPSPGKFPSKALMIFTPTSHPTPSPGPVPVSQGVASLRSLLLYGGGADPQEGDLRSWACRQGPYDSLQSWAPVFAGQGTLGWGSKPGYTLVSGLQCSHLQKGYTELGAALRPLQADLTCGFLSVLSAFSWLSSLPSFLSIILYMNIFLGLIILSYKSPIPAMKELLLYRVENAASVDICDVDFQKVS